MTDDFEWDPEKARRNLNKHGVSFGESASVFFDPLSVTVSDPLHSADENRLITIGHSILQRHLVVAHAERGDKIRIITARVATAAEKRKYEKENR